MFYVAALILLLIVPGLASAHTPHDEVEVVRLSAAYWLDHTVFAIVRDNLYASFDAGRSWFLSHINLPRSRARDVMLSPHFAKDGRLILVTESGLYRSENRGRNWSRTRCDSSTDQLLDAPPAGLMKLCLAPFIPGEKPAAIALIHNRLLLTRDFGESWQDTGICVDRASCLCADGTSLYVGSEPGFISVFSWTDGGIKRDTLIQLESRLFPTAIEVDHLNRLLIGTQLEGVWSAVFSDGRYEVSNLGLRGKRVTGISISPDHKGGSTFFATEWHDGVYRSRDGGQHWELASANLTRDPQADHPRFKTSHFKSVVGAVSADGRSELYVAGFDGLFRSHDQGGRWSEIDNIVTSDIIVGLDTVAGSGCVVSLYGAGVRPISVGPASAPENPLLHGLRTFAIASPPELAGRSPEVWIAVHDGVRIADANLRLLRDASLSPQSRPTSRLASRWRSRLTPLAKRALRSLHPGLRSTLRSSIHKGLQAYGIGLQTPVFGSSFLFAPDFAASGVAYLRTWTSGLFRTVDGGRTFRCIWRPDEGQRLVSAGIGHCGQTRWLLLLTEQQLLRSEDDGRSWVSVPVPPAADRFVTMAVLPSASAEFRLLLSTASGLYLLTVTPDPLARREMLIESCSHGSVFTEIALSPDCPQSGIVLANKSGFGLFRSEDGGATFSPVHAGAELDCSAMAGFPDGDTMIAFSRTFAADGVVYAASGRAVFVSRNRGVDWERLAGMPPDEN